MLGSLPLPVHQSIESSGDFTMYLQITCLKDSFWVWATGSEGGSEPGANIGPFAMAMVTPFVLTIC
jgi:hypothetical protein